MRPVLLLLLGAHAAFAVQHSLVYVYTGTSGLSNVPEFVSVGLVDGQLFTYYDSNIRRETPRQEWMAKSVGADYWESQTQILIGQEQSFKNNINVAKERFNQTGGVHTVQRMLGCEWDDQTGDTRGFLQYGYDGEDFLSLDLKELRYISPVQQGGVTVQKWNNNRALIENDYNYFSSECVEWLQKYVEYGRSSLEKTVSPHVSVFQKSSSSSSSSPSVSCHATGFYPSGITITWMRNGEEHHEDVDLGELLPNEDGTFQRTSTITVSPEELRNNKFSCEVQHQGGNKSVDVDAPLPISLIVGVVVALLLVLIGVGVFCVYKRNKGFKNSSAEKSKSKTSVNSDPGYSSNSDSNSDSSSDSGSLKDTGSISDIASVNSDSSDDSTKALLRKGTRQN